ETRRRLFDMLRATDAVSVGGKAANLGELTQVLPAANRVSGGFGIPFSFYRDFLSVTGLQPRLDNLLADPRLATDSQFRRQALTSLRKLIEDAEVPPAMLAQIGDAVRAAFPDQPNMPVRLRSSSNVEDGEFVSGAGLHDSARGCLADDLDNDELGPSKCLDADERADMQAQLDRRPAEYAAHS